MQAAPGETIVDKQPNDRMCFVRGVEDPIGLKTEFRQLVPLDQERASSELDFWQGTPGKLRTGRPRPV
jgi:hypothetical protein